MSVQTASLTMTLPRPSSAPPEARELTSSDIATSYDGSSIVYRLMRIEGWGPTLLNLGYFPWRGPLGFLNCLLNLEQAQQTMVLNAARLLQPEPNHRILDIACGRGKSSFMLSCLQPEATVVGLDLLEENVAVASTLFNQIRSLSYRAGTAMNLPFAADNFDRATCIEAAFHFPNRELFLREAFRVLKPGGRLVVIDFAWNSDADRQHLDHAHTRLVRDIWQWDDFSTLDEYRSMAREAGFDITGQYDWSRHVTRPIQQRFRLVSLISSTKWGRRLLKFYNPLYQSVTDADWDAARQAVDAHAYVQQRSKYMAFVFEKPDRIAR